MKDWPSGSYLIVECEELRIFIVWYKYNYKKKGKRLKNICFFAPTQHTNTKYLCCVC